MKYEKGKKECKRKLLLGQKIEEKNKEQKKNKSTNFHNSLFPLIFDLLILSSSRCPLWQHDSISQTQTNESPAANQRKVAHDIWEQISKFRTHAMLSGRTSHFILSIFRSFSFSTFVALGFSDV